MKLKQVKLKWFKIAFIPACERIQVSLKRNHAFQIWREDMLAQREQGEKLTRSLERISIFKAFRTWKLDMLFLKAMEHGVITVRDDASTSGTNSSSSGRSGMNSSKKQRQ